MNSRNSNINSIVSIKNNNYNNINKNNLKYYNIPMNFYPTKCIDCGINNRFICSECINYFDFSLCKNCHQAFIHGNSNTMNCNNSNCDNIHNHQNQNNFIGSPYASSCSTTFSDEFDNYQDIADPDYFDNSHYGFIDYKYFYHHHHHSNQNHNQQQQQHYNKLFTCPYLNCLKEGFNEESLALHLLQNHEEEILLNTYVVCPFCSCRSYDGKFLEHIKENHLNNNNNLETELNNGINNSNNNTENLVS